MNQRLRLELLRMVGEDERVREELAHEGSLFDGYHPRMERVHAAHATRLEQMIAEHGWPGASLVGEDGAKAAWLIVQHAISRPHFMRRALGLVREAAERGELPKWCMAMLEDRIRVLEGRPQVYGTSFDWDEGGELAPDPMEDEAHVDERRRAVGLCTLAERTREMRKYARADGEKPPIDWHARKRKMEAWAKKVGWRR